MAAKTNVEKDTSGREIVLTRLINAPRELVFSAWTDAKHLTQWWGPNGFSITIKKMDFREGGSWKYIMHGPDGHNYDNYIHYHEIAKPERLHYDHGGNEGEVHFTVTVTFEDQGGKTLVTQRSVFPTAEARNYVVEKYGAIEGGKQHLSNLDAYTKRLLPSSGVAPFTTECTFKAPINLMFDMWTKPEHLQHWLGPKGAKSEYSKMDFRVGGHYHYCLDYAGVKMWGKSIYQEIVKPDKIVYVSTFSDKDGGLGRHPLAPTWPAEMLTTINFTEHIGYTTVKIEWLPINATAEEIKTFDDGRSSMTQGWGWSLDRLDQYLHRDLEIVSSRLFDHPREKVFKAWSDAKILAQWWGPKGFTNTFHGFEFKVGGRSKYTMHAPDGTDFLNECEYVEISAPNKIVFDHLAPIHVFRVIATFDDMGGKTEVTFRMHFEDVAECKKTKVYAVEANEQNFDRLEDVLKKIN